MCEVNNEDQKYPIIGKYVIFETRYYVIMICESTHDDGINRLVTTLSTLHTSNTQQLNSLVQPFLTALLLVLRVI